MSDDLIAFLTTRLDEDASELEAKISRLLKLYHADGLYDLTREEMLAPSDPNEPQEIPREAREIASKRAIVTYEDRHGLPGINAWGIWRDVLKHLAAVYSNHPDYQQEWKL